MRKALEIKNTVLAVLLAGLLLPFVLQTNLYPFFRYSMFAEPIKYSVQSERFIVMMALESGQLLRLDPLKVGIHQSTFDYLLRNHYYRQEHTEFLHKLSQLWPHNQPVEALHMLRVVEKDTMQVASLPLRDAMLMTN